MPEYRTSIRVAAQRTGLTAHVIRMWEKRYHAVTPDRTDTKRRLYSEAEIERLSLLRIATAGGHRIGDIARLPTEKLRELVRPRAPAPSDLLSPASSRSAEDTIRGCIAAALAFDGAALEAEFERASVAFGTRGLLQLVIAPFATRVGELWHAGTLTAAQEHFASSSTRSFLQRRIGPFADSDSAPTLLVVTPTGQLHEIGAVVVAAAARDLGWRVLYLGSSLPAADIAGAAIANRARAVALSIVYPGDDPHLPEELRQLRKLLPDSIKILAGGRAAESYAAALDAIGAPWAQDLSALDRLLDSLRATPAPTHT